MNSLPPRLGVAFFRALQAGLASLPCEKAVKSVRQACGMGNHHRVRRARLVARAGRSIREGIEVSQLTEFPKPANTAATDEASGLASFAPLGTALKVLLVWPRFPSSFWSMDGILDLVPIKTDQPPLGLLTVAALCPKTWTLRLIDRSFEELLDTDILWADLVMVSGMRVQKDDIRETLLTCIIHES